MKTTLLQRIQSPGSKRILALDGGGIRGAIAIEVLSEIEALLRKQSGDPALVLADYFDFVAGTSTGAIIAACVARRMTVEAIREFYHASGPAMFAKAWITKRFRYRFEDDVLADKLRSVFGADTRLGSEELSSVLMMVLRNASTDSPWPLSNNPLAKYNARTSADAASVDGCNLELPLWQLVRASTAAPTYFPPEVIKVGAREFVFVDGGITVYNNPAFQAFLMATIAPYRMSWRASKEALLVISVGTGSSANANANLRPDDLNLLYNAGSIPSALMHAASNEQDILCRVFGECRIGDPIDCELGDLRFGSAPAGADKLFAYARYNVELSVPGLARLGIHGMDPASVQPLDAVERLAELRTIGVALAESVRLDHFQGFLPQNP